MNINKIRQHSLKTALYMLLAIMLLMTVYPFVVSVIGVYTGVYTPIKVLKEIVLFALLIFLLGYILTNSDIRHKFLSDRLNVAIGLYILVTSLFTLITIRQGEFEAAVAGFFMNTRLLTIFIVIQLLICALKKQKMEKSVQKFMKYFLILSLFVAIFAIMQVTVLPATFLEVFGYNGLTTPPPYSTVDNNINVLRAFSTMWAPNMLGSFLLLPLAIFFTLSLQKYKSIYTSLGVITTFAAIFATHSRSAILAALITLFIVLLLQKRELLSRHFKTLTVCIVFIVVMGVLVSGHSSVRLLIFHSSEGDASLTEGSTDDHFVAIRKNFLDALQHPVGQGVGTAGPSSFQLNSSSPKIAENYFIQITQEVGVLGLLLFCYISTIVGWRLFKLSTAKNNLAIALFASFVAINIINLFLHGWADDPTSIVWWGFAALVLYLPDNINLGEKRNLFREWYNKKLQILSH